MPSPSRSTSRPSSHPCRPRSGFMPMLVTRAAFAPTTCLRVKRARPPPSPEAMPFVRRPSSVRAARALPERNRAVFPQSVEQLREHVGTTERRSRGGQRIERLQAVAVRSRDTEQGSLPPHLVVTGRHYDAIKQLVAGRVGHEQHVDALAEVSTLPHLANGRSKQ